MLLENKIEILLFGTNILLSTWLLIRDNLFTKVFYGFLIVYLTIKMTLLYFSKKRRVNYKIFKFLYY
jgi:hypothetical protein